MRALRKDFYMQILKTLNRFLSIVLIVALGVSFYAGITSTEPDMRYTADYFYDQGNMCDIKIVSTLGLTEYDLEKISKVDGVEKAIGSYSFDTVASLGDNEYTLKIMGYTEGINDITLKEGRLPENNNECIVDNQLTESEFKIGDVIEIQSENLEGDIDKLTVVGSFTTPLYISRDKGTTTVGNGRLGGLLIVNESVFNMDYYTEIYIKVKDADKLLSASDEYEDCVDKVVKRIENEIKKECEKARYDEILNEAKDEIEDAKEEVDDAQKEYDDGLKEYEDGLEEVSNNEDKLSDAQDEIDSGESDLKDAKEQIEEGEKELNKAKEEIAQNEKDLEDGYKQYYEGLKEYKSGLRKYKKGLKKYKTGYKKYKEGLKDYNKGLKEYNSGFAAYSEGVSEYEAGVESYEAAVSMYGEEAVADKKKELDEVKTTLDSTKDALDEAKIELDKGETELKKSETELKNAKKKLNSSKKELNKAKKTLDNTKETLDEAAIKIEEGKTTIKEKEAELEDAKKEYKEGKKEIKDSKKEVKKGYEEIADAKEKLADAKKELEDGKKQIEDANTEIADAEEEIKELSYPEWYVLDRNYIESYVEYDMDAARIGNIGKVFPIFFFLVAAMVCLTSMTRMVEEHRTEIGTYKALGYNKIQIALKYILYAALATLIGGILGGLLGSLIFPVIIIKAYGIMFVNLEHLVIKIDPFYMGISIIIAFFSISFAALLSCINELRSTPATLMRPEAPKAGKKVLLERIPFIWSKLSFNTKSTCRNLFRYKKRLFMTLFGIGGSCALMLVGYGVRDSIRSIVEIQYGDISNYDMVINYNTDDYNEDEIEDKKKEILNDDRIEEYMDIYQTSTDARANGKKYSVYVYVPENEEKFKEYCNLRHRQTKEKIDIPKEGIVIDEKLATLLNVKKGDSIELEDKDGYRINCQVEDIFENYTFHYIYMSKDYYQDSFGEDIIYNASIVKNKSGYHDYSDAMSSDLLEEDVVGGVNYLSTTRDTIDNMLVSMNGIIMVLIVCAAALAFVVLYNLNNVNIAERKRELATLKVLGFYDGEVSAYIYRENIIITIMGIGLGLLFGKALHLFVITEAEIDSMMFGRDIKIQSIIASVLFTILFAVIINFMMHISLKKVDMATSLKSVE